VTVTPDFDPADLEQFLGGPVRISPVSGGQSNPTWFVTFNNQDLVLRKKPRGTTLASAHAIDREYRILAALQTSAVPVPQVLQMVDDAAVIGTPFYLMTRLAGAVSDTTDLPDLTPQDRRSIHLDAARVLAHLHQLDWAALGLSDFGRHDGYYARQVRRWCGQWHANETRSDPLLDQLADWFGANIPPETPTTIVHGDYRIGNLLYGRDPARIMGVLDWELSTLGDPLSDLAHWSMFYDLQPYQMGGLAGLDLRALGLPDRREFLDAYAAAGGCSAPLAPFHRAFAMFRMSVILEGITARAEAGQSTSEDARAVGALAPDFARLAEKLLAADTHTAP
jgi:aminoglycoside phosphotransferase (APT) family kinase protein